jgi:hypothetical protein
MILEKPFLTIDQVYFAKCNQHSDINEHLPILKSYAEICEHITEFGVRSVVSTYAFMAGKPHTIRSYDIEPIENFGIDREYLKFFAFHNGIDFEFNVNDVLSLTIQQTDLLFIDTLHTYTQLKKELELHSNSVNKFIILHDTETFGTIGENGEIGLWLSVEEFLKKDFNWVLHEKYANNNGLTVLKRVR